MGLVLCFIQINGGNERGEYAWLYFGDVWLKYLDRTNIFSCARNLYNFLNEGIDKKKKKKKKRISTWLLLPHLDLIYFCDMTEWLQAKTRLLTRTQVLPIHTISCHTKNSTKPAGLYLSSKSMSFILIQSHFALILRYNYWRSTVLFASGNKWKKSLTLISAQLEDTCFSIVICL